MEIKKTDLPYWLLPRTPPVADLPIKATEPIYTEAIWGEIREHLMNGETLKKVSELPHMPNGEARLRRWILKDPIRKKEYLEAKEFATYALEERMITISDGTDNDYEDVSRSKLRIDTLKYIMAVNNKDRYDKTANTNINVTTNNMETNHTITIVSPDGKANNPNNPDNQPKIIDVTPTSTSSTSSTSPTLSNTGGEDTNDE